MKYIRIFMIDDPDIFYDIKDPDDMQDIVDGKYDHNIWEWEFKDY